ncbi:hypothetical protein, partial [Thalassospira sp. MCCC 1A02803]|uniref:hypothetical protein n=1 Tax=Thalassospira sp. MCCC 1A02803 TaxID=501863 RepID=UPI001AEFE6C1
MNSQGQTCNFPDHKIDHHQTSCSGAFETDLHSLQEIELRCNRNQQAEIHFHADPLPRTGLFNAGQGLRDRSGIAMGNMMAKAGYAKPPELLGSGGFELVSPTG